MPNTTSELAENKLILLYIMDKINLPISNLVLTEIVLSTNLIDYFALQQYLFELQSSGMIRNIEKDSKTLLELTPEGDNVLSMFGPRISDSKMNLLDVYLEQHIENIKQEITITADYTIDEHDNFIVNLGVMEDDVILIDLKLNVGSNEQAKQLCNKWRNSASTLYPDIISLLAD